MSTLHTLRLHALACAVVSCLCAPAALAQDTAAAPAAPPAADSAAVNLDSVFVTGTSTATTKLKSSVSVSTVGAEAIEQSAPRSTAEIFRNIPGIRSESSGGEGNANIAVRGLPVASGGAKFLQLQEDGLPVMEFGDIAFGNADIFLRSDFTMDRIEAIRGGSASTFTSNAPGGIINFISKTGDTEGGSVGVSRGLDYDNTRIDFNYGAPFAEHWQFNIGGFFRQGDGVRDAGYTTDKGGQLKANLTRLFENGYVRVYGKYLNDRAAGYLPVPTSVRGRDGSPDLGGFPGFDPGNDTLYSRNFRTDVGLDGNNRPRRTDLGDGMHPISRTIGAEAWFDLGSGWNLSEKFRVADNSGRFVSPFPAEVTDAASLASSIGGAGAQLVEAGGPNAGQAYTGTAIRTHLFNVAINDLGNVTNDLSLSREFDGDGRTLNLRMGYYSSRQTIDMDWTWNSYVQSLGRDSRLLNVVDAAGVSRSQNGLYAYGTPFWGDCCITRSYDVRYDVNAPYLALTFDSGKFSIDGSLRYDMGDARGSYSGTAIAQNLDVNGDGVIQPVEQRVATVDTANARPVNYDWNYLSYSLGTNYLINDDLGAFARISRGARANADRLLFGVVRDDGSVSSDEGVNVVRQAEAGLKWRRDGLSLFATAFSARTQEQNFEVTSQRFFNRSYEAHGVELEASYRYEGFTVNGGLTWTDAEISRDQITPENTGNVPRRQADVVWQLTPSYRGDGYQFGVNLIGTTDAYTQDSNQLKMPGYTQVNLFGDYRVTDSLTVALNVNNLFNTFGLTEAEEATIPANGIIRARSIAGRTTSLSLRYDFPKDPAPGPGPAASNEHLLTDSTALRAAFAASLDAQRATALLTRFDRHAPRLLHALQSLYGQRPDYAAWLTQWLGALGSSAQQRPHALQQLDATRKPGWFGAQHMLGYSAYVDRFAGTLQGVAERVPYLQELGVRYLHLLPFLRARAGDNDGGFAVSDYGQVEPSLGSNDDLVALTTRLRASGISLCADFVLNHTADDHAWARAARAGDARYLDYYHHFADRSLPDQYETTLGQVFPHTAPGNFTWVEEAAQWMWTTFYPYQWDLNWSNPAVFGEMALAMLQLANLGVEAFRLDSTAYLWKRTGTDCMNQPEAHTLLVALRAVADIVAPSVAMKAEAIVPMADLPPYFGSGADQGHECHLAYHSTLMAAGWSALALQRGDILHNVIAHSPPLPANCAWLSYVRCHDDIGWNVLQHEASGNAMQPPFSLRDVARFYANESPGSYARGESFQSSGDGVHGTNGMAAALAGIQAAQETDDAAALRSAVDRLVLLYAIALAMPGVPLIYMGDELALPNDIGYRMDAHRQHEGRWLHRPAMDWQRAAQRHDSSSVSGQVYQRLHALIQQRAALPALASDQSLGSMALDTPQLFALTRGDRFIAVHNFSAQALDVVLAGRLSGRWQVLADQPDAVTQPLGDDLRLALPGHAVRWLERID